MTDKAELDTLGLFKEQHRNEYDYYKGVIEPFCEKRILVTEQDLLYLVKLSGLFDRYSVVNRKIHLEDVEYNQITLEYNIKKLKDWNVYATVNIPRANNLVLDVLVYACRKEMTQSSLCSKYTKRFILGNTNGQVFFADTYDETDLYNMINTLIKHPAIAYCKSAYSHEYPEVNYVRTYVSCKVNKVYSVIHSRIMSFVTKAKINRTLAKHNITYGYKQKEVKNGKIIWCVVVQFLPDVTDEQKQRLIDDLHKIENTRIVEK